MQQDGLNRLGYSAYRTMRIAQVLYSGVELKDEGLVGLITYMRTDSTRIAPSALDQTRAFIAENIGKEYLPENPVIYKTKKKAQDAHEAIRPTDITRTPEKVSDSLGPAEYKLYKLIYNRFLASQMNPAILLQTSINIKGINGDTDFGLKLSYSKYKFDGFTKVYSYNNNKDPIKGLPDIGEGESLDFKDLKSIQHFTQPPPRYNDASLVKVLEESGIGRPSTYAPTIATLDFRYYITREGRQLIPTELGQVVNGLLTEHFPEIVNTNFTSEIEEKLDKIAEEKADWKEMLREFYPSFIESVEKALENIEEIEDFKKGIPTDEVCEKCGSPMVEKIGRYGRFLACSGFPECRNAKPLPIADCPVPGCDGKIVLRRSRKRRKFYACSKEDCNYVLWKKPLKENCPECNYYLVLSKTKNRQLKKCSNKECDYEIEEKGSVEYVE